MAGQVSSNRDAPLLAVLSNPRPPLEVQRKSADLIATHGRLIVRLPTASGKTLLAALPFAAGLTPARQLLFATPLRSLTSQQARVLRAEIDPERAAEARGAPWEVREQSGAMPDDPRFLAPAVVCTFDQLISAACGIGYSVSAGQRNVTPGAFWTAGIVADELHLYPRKQALTSLIWLLAQRPRDPALPFLLLTATLSTPLARHLADLLDAELVDGLPAEDAATLGISRRVRSIELQATPIAATQIVQAATEGQQVLVVVNTVARAIELGREVMEVLSDQDVVVLHARFLPEHRADAESRLRSAFGRDASPLGAPRVAITTQVVEAGLDLSADLLLTELAPASSLIQRAGRCARWGGVGRVVVAFPPEGGGKIWPYAAEPGGQELCERTADWLQQHALLPIPLDDATESALLAAAHEADDTAWLAGVERALSSRRDEIGRALAMGDYGLAGVLVRNVNSRTVLVHGEPDSVERPFTMSGFALPPGVLRRLLAESNVPPEESEGEDLPSLELPPPAGWRLKVPVWEGADQERPSTRAGVVGGWRDALVADMNREPLWLASPALFSYDPELGLRPRSPDEPSVAEEFWSAKRDGVVARPIFHSRRAETLEQHVRRMLAVLEEHLALWPRLQPAAVVYEEAWGWPPGTLLRLVRAAIVAHDAGKLSSAWQAEIANFQRNIGAPVLPFLAHSAEPPAGRPPPPWRPPPHAVSGAAHTLPLGDALDTELATAMPLRPAERRGRPSAARVLFHAVATHHSANAQPIVRSQAEQLDEPALAELRRLLTVLGLPAAAAPATVGEPLDYHVVDVQALEQTKNLHEMIALQLVARALRLADGWSQEPPWRDKPVV